MYVGFEWNFGANDAPKCCTVIKRRRSDEMIELTMTNELMLYYSYFYGIYYVS